MLSFWSIERFGIWQGLNPGMNQTDSLTHLPDDKILDYSKLKQITDVILKCI